MSSRRILLLVFVIGIALSFTSDGNACVVGYTTQSCGGPNFSCSTTINVPVSAWADGGTPTMQPVGCCGGFAATMVGINFDCHVTELDDLHTPQGNPALKREVVAVKKATPLYLPDCDGWLVMYQSIATRPGKPA